AIVDFRPRGPGHVEEGGVQVGPAGHSREHALAAGEGQADRAPRRGADHHVVHHLPAGHEGRAQAEGLVVAEGAGGQAVAATLVPWEGGPVDDDDVTARSGEGYGGGGAGGAAPDDNDVGLEHLLDATRTVFGRMSERSERVNVAASPAQGAAPGLASA